MKDEPIPDDNHISRYCRWTSLTPKGEVSGVSFELGTKTDGQKEEYLSVNWLEFLNFSDREAEIREIRRVLATKLTLGTKAKIAVLNVGNAKSHVFHKSPDKRMLRILHRPDEPPDKPDPSHSGIFDTLNNENVIAILLAEQVQETYPAR